MERFFRVTIISLLFVTLGGFESKANADISQCCQTLCQCLPRIDCDNYISIDALYWKPMHCPIFVARRSSNNVSPAPRNETYLIGEYDPGVRIRLGCEGCHWFADVAYLYFHPDEDVSVDQEGYQRMIIAGSPPFTQGDTELTAKACVDYRYQNVDGRLGRDFCSGCNFSTYLYGNVRWVKIDFENHIRAVPDGFTTFSDFFREEACFNGGGFGLGFGGNYAICGGLSLRANTGLMAIIGETRLQHLESNFELAGNVNNAFLDEAQSWCHILPALDFKIGLEYVCNPWSIDWSVEIGYELNYYSRALRYASLNAVSTPGSERIPLLTCEDIAFAGPYFNLTVRF